MEYLAIGLVPIVWVLIQIYIATPLSRLAQVHLPPEIAYMLTKKRGE